MLINTNIFLLNQSFPTFWLKLMVTEVALIARVQLDSSTSLRQIHNWDGLSTIAPLQARWIMQPMKVHWWRQMNVGWQHWWKYSLDHSRWVLKTKTFIPLMAKCTFLDRHILHNSIIQLKFILQWRFRSSFCPTRCAVFIGSYKT